MQKLLEFVSKDKGIQEIVEIISGTYRITGYNFPLYCKITNI